MRFVWDIMKTTQLTGTNFALRRGYVPKPREKRKFANSLSPSQIQRFIILFVFLLSLQKHCDGSCIYYSLQVPEHHVEWLEDLPELPSNFDASLH